MRRLLGTALLAIASCGWVFPADTQAQTCPGHTIRDRGTDVCVLTPESLPSLTDALDSLTAVLARAEAVLAGISPVEFGQLRDRVAAESARMGVLESRLTDAERLIDSLMSVLPGVPPDTVPTPPPPPPPPPDTTVTPPPPPPDTTAPPDTASLAAPASIRLVSENSRWYAAWSPVPGADAHVVSWLDTVAVTTNGPNASGEIWMNLGDVGTLEGEDVCAAGRVAGVAGPEACDTVPAGGVTPPPPPPPPPDTTVTNPPPGDGPVPDTPGTWNPQGTLRCDEDFTRYSDFADWRARALCGWNIANVEAWGPNNTAISSRGLMYRHRTDSNPCRDATVGQAQTTIPASAEIWMEFTVEWGPNIDFSPNTQTGTRCGGGYKFVLTWNDQPSSQGYQRWDWIVWNHAGYEASVPGFSQMDDVPVNPGAPYILGDASTKTYPPHTVRSNLAGAPNPGQTQTYRVHFRDNRDGTFRVYAEVDGVVTHDYVTNSISDSGLMQRFMLGSNRNSYAEVDQFMWWKSFKVWAR